MKLTSAELAYVCSKGLYVPEKCAGCGKLLNQTFRYTIAGKPEAYCSAACRDLVFFRDRREARKHCTPGKCACCGGSLDSKKRGALFCDDKCRKRASRTGTGGKTAEVEKSRAPTQSNQQIAYAKNLGQEDRTTGAPQPFIKTLGGVAGELGSPVDVEQRVSGSIRGARPELSRLSIPPTRTCPALDKK